MPRSYTHGIYGDDKSFAGLGNGNTIASLTRVNVVEMYVDFVHGQDVLKGVFGDWKVNVVGGSAGVDWSIIENSRNGLAALNSGDTAAKGYEACMWDATAGAGEFLVPSDSKWITYVTKVGKSDADTSAMFAGLASGAATVLGTDGDFVATDYAGFYTPIDSDALMFRSARSSGSEASSYDMGITLTDGELVVVGFRIEVRDISDDADNGAIRLFKMKSGFDVSGQVPTFRSDQDPGPLGRWIELDDAPATTLNAIPNDSISPCYSIVNNATATDTLLYVDSLYCSTLRA